MRFVSNYKLASGIFLVAGIILIAYIIIAFDEGSFHQYGIGAVVGSILFKIFSKRIVSEINLGEEVISITYYLSFRKHTYEALIEDLNFRFRKKQVTPVSQARCLEFYSPENDLICYLTTELFLWDDKTIKSISRKLSVNSISE